MWLLADLFHDLPGLEDVDKLRLVFYLDEARASWRPGAAIPAGPRTSTRAGRRPASRPSSTPRRSGRRRR
ncbi:helicase HerA-like domain-containing protein [Streptomyces luteogriseus]|uniref:helicase HerA-like domain-containing protein n=1 Tax=Streptomyces luteogriseus TaxID=68233 RepID=UPI003788D343